MESDDFTRNYIIRYLSARELVLPPLAMYNTLALHVPATRHCDAVYLNIATHPQAYDCMVAMEHNLECDTGKDSGQKHGEYLACQYTWACCAA